MDILRSKLMMAISLIPFMGIVLIPISFNALLAWEAIPAIMGVALLTLQIKDDYITGKNSISNSKRNFLIIMALYSFEMLFSGLVHDNLTVGILYTFSFYFFTIIYMDQCMVHFDRFINVITCIFAFIVVGGYIYRIISPINAFRYHGDEINFVGILGSKNGVQMTILPAITFFFLRIYFYKGKDKWLLGSLIALSLLYMYQSRSGTAIVITLIIPIYLLIYPKIKLSFKFMSITYVIIYFSIVVFRLQEVFFYDFITKVLQKDITLSDRTNIWDYIFANIFKSPIIGFGPRNDLIWKKFVKISEAHNGFLEILIGGGIIAVVLLICIFCIVGKELDKYKDSPMANLLVFFFFVYAIMGLTESMFGFVKMLFWAMMVTGLNIGNIIEQSNQVTRKEKKL